MAVRIQWRHDTASNWTSNNPTLAIGEPGFETDTGKYKIGDGSAAWNSLSYGAFSDNPIAALFTAQGSDPSPPASNKLAVYSKTVAGRMMLRQMGPSGLTTILQPFLGRNKIGYWAPPGNATTVPVVFGYTAPTAIGTATASNVATTNMFTRMRRLTYLSATSASAYAGQRVAANQVSLNYGFYKIVRFGISDPVIASPTNMFVGVSNTNSAPSGGTEPSALTQCIGVGHTSTDTNLKIFYGGNAAQTPIDLGSDFPINVTGTDAYELALFAPAATNTVYYEVTRLNTGHVATGSITDPTNLVALPPLTTLLNYCWHWRCNLATGVAVGLDIMSDYIETDN
jgi:hypothetical protein